MSSQISSQNISDLILEHLMSSQISSQNISDHLRSSQIISDLISDHLRTSQIISDHLRTSQIISEHLRSSQIISCHLRSSQILSCLISEHLRSSQIISCHLRTSQIISDHLRSSLTHHKFVHELPEMGEAALLGQRVGVVPGPVHHAVGLQRPGAPQQDRGQLLQAVLGREVEQRGKLLAALVWRMKSGQRRSRRGVSPEKKRLCPGTGVVDLDLRFRGTLPEVFTDTSAEHLWGNIWGMPCK